MRKEEFIRRIDELSSAKRKLLASQLAGPASSASDKGSRVIAYVVAETTMNAQKMRDRLKQRLPAYMIPAEFVMVDKLPRLPNGKVDHRALPALGLPRISEESTYAAPRSPIEEKLATIWENVLDIHPVGIHDNFFEIGGDSILSIQIVAQARKAGLQLGANQLFEHQTIAELSLFVQPEKERSSNLETPIGPTPLTPIQRWFFEEHTAAPDHWNQVLSFTVNGNVSATAIKNAIDNLVQRHDALRLSFTNTSGSWMAMILDHKDTNVFHHFQLRNQSEKEQDEVIEENLRAIQQSFDLSKGSLFRGALFECEPIRRNKLVLIAHHLVVDAVSWQIISDEVTTLINENNSILSWTPTTSYQAWSRHLAQEAQGGKFDSELSFWKTQERYLTTLPTDFPASVPVTEETTETYAFSLDRQTTDLLFTDALTAYRMRPDEVLITALLQIAESSGLEGITIWLERHGRETLNPDINLSSTVGWFTTVFPLAFTCDVGADHAKRLKLAKEQLRAVPNGGLGYGILRYLRYAGEQKLTQRPLLIFNYLGDQTMKASGQLSDAAMMFTGTRHPKSERFNLLEINCYRQNGELQFRWTYSRSHYLARTIEQLSNNFMMRLRELIDHCITIKDRGYTPSDFPEAGLNQEDLDELLNSL